MTRRLPRRLPGPMLLLVGLVSLLAGVGGADAASCTGEGWAAGGAIAVVVSCGGGDGSSPSAPDQGPPPAPPYDDYTWTSVCSRSPADAGGGRDCAATSTCPGLEERRWQRWGRRPNGEWVALETGCFAGGPPESGTPAVTPDDVSSALRQVQLPRLRTYVQPARETLVNFETVFYTGPAPVDLELTVLGQPVEVVATPLTYRWVFGDGTETATPGPGHPYPGATVVHVYEHARVTVHPRVDVTYAARFRVGAGAWQDIGHVTTVGPPTDLRVAEATPLLSGDHP